MHVRLSVLRDGMMGVMSAQPSLNLVAEQHTGFGVTQPTLWRWRKQLTTQGLVGLVSEKRGPKGPSRVTPEVQAEIFTRRAKGETLREIAQATGISIGTAGRITNP